MLYQCAFVESSSKYHTFKFKTFTECMLNTVKHTYISFNFHYILNILTFILKHSRKADKNNRETFQKLYILIIPNAVIYLWILIIDSEVCKYICLNKCKYTRHLFPLGYDPIVFINSNDMSVLTKMHCFCVQYGQDALRY